MTTKTASPSSSSGSPNASRPRPKAYPWWRLGLRNLGRNRRRTLITAMGLAMGYFSVVLLIGWADGISAEMIDNGTGLLSGQIQIHASDYRPERSLYDTIGAREGIDVADWLQTAEADPSITAAAPRVYAGALVSSGDATSAGIIVGIDPEREPLVTRLLSGIVEGRSVLAGANELVVGIEMARQLAVVPGDELVVVAPAADGSMGNDLFTVAGIFRSGMTELDATQVMAPIDALQRLVVLPPGRVHELALKTSDPWEAPDAAERLDAALTGLGIPVEIAAWTILRPDMLEYAQLIESWYFIIILIVFFVAIFGVANTMLMATFERRREFAVMLALGTTPSQVVVTVISEAVALGFFSLLLGASVTFPLMYWWHNAPLDLSWIYGEFTMFGALMRPTLRVEYNFPAAAWAALALFLTATLAAVYPAARAAMTPPADTLSGL